MSGICPKCRRFKRLTRHHIQPLRWFGHSDRIIRICRDCHNSIELLIPFEKQPVKFYYQIVKIFLQGGESDATDYYDNLQNLRQG